jgi:hypothetical protein
MDLFALIICPDCKKLFPFFSANPFAWNWKSRFKSHESECRKCKRQFKIIFSFKNILFVLPVVIILGCVVIALLGTNILSAIICGLLGCFGLACCFAVKDKEVIGKS